jgi:TRAP transporter TAXI family solute receptor
MTNSPTTLRSHFATTVVAVVCSLSFVPVFAQSRPMTIGTGAVTGVYYAAGGSICKAVNRDRATHGIRCLVEVSQGSTANIDSLARGNVSMALVQSDVQYRAAKGEGAFAKSAVQADLRSVFGLYAETFTAMATPDVGAKSFADLKGRKVSLGVAGSGSRTTVEDLLSIYGFQATDFAAVTERSADEQGYALCEKKIDAALYVVGHPVTHITRTTKDCGAQLVGMADPDRERVVAARPYFVKSEISAGTYANQTSAVTSVGMVATVTTMASVPEATVYAVVKGVFDNFDEFKRLHPAFSQLDPKRMVSEGLSAPLHPGALKYYKEKGWVQ